MERNTREMCLLTSVGEQQGRDSYKARGIERELLLMQRKYIFEPIVQGFRDGDTQKIASEPPGTTVVNKSCAS